MKKIEEYRCHDICNSSKSTHLEPATKSIYICTRGSGTGCQILKRYRYKNNLKGYLDGVKKARAWIDNHIKNK